jgi:hypothetical protein
MRKVSDKSRENQNRFFVQKFFFRNRAAYEKMWKNIAEPNRGLRRMRIACWITKAKIQTHENKIIYQSNTIFFITFFVRKVLRLSL